MGGDVVLRPTPAVRMETIRGRRVVLDSELAIVFGVETKRLNEAVKRNRDRFPTDWVFQISDQEFDDLRSQKATSNPGAGGRRYAPWAFTEHGVVAAAGVLNSPQAIAVQHMVVEAFVADRRGDRTPTRNAVAKVAGLAPLSGAFAGKLETVLSALLDDVVLSRAGAAIRDDALALLGEGLSHIRERLKRAGAENEEIVARAVKLLAEAEVSKAEAGRVRAEASRTELQTLARKLRLVLEAQQALAYGELTGFLAVLDDLGAA